MPEADQLSHHGSHEKLLAKPPLPLPVTPLRVSSDVDAIIVPTRRPVDRLNNVAQVATTLGWTLVTLHSGGSSAADAVAKLPVGVDLIAVDVPDARFLRIPRMNTSKLLSGSVFERKSDLSTKRNLAIVLSRMLGWSRVLFLDDDIEVISIEDLKRASTLLGQYQAVGLHIGGYPDNSVVCHAYRDAGGEQKSFVGAGALVVDIARCDSFFPDIYNDDWFFLLNGDHQLLPTAITGQVIQYPYDPFENPKRAKSEELGDVLAEGLFWLLDENRPIYAANRQYWDDYLLLRRGFIETVIDMIGQANDMSEAQKAKRVTALEASLGRLRLITPDFCESYLHAWMADKEKWQRFLSELPTQLPDEQALSKLSRRCLPRRRRLQCHVRRVDSGSAKTDP